ncbi:Monocarboxylate transporter 9 like protein [Argiope bruennichi]|uniref:Monocarboxylate transporter 9 like protein n=1 Tax=Argiope bruennichi TaxID=94029 RepID=A0A8T0E8S1_ARGBR|nr:Monocarboxylate transporter 9 like protein [Argiope bruennichi]
MRRRWRYEETDKGWSWVVVFAACFVSFVLDGIFRSSRVLEVPFVEAFGVTKEEASWPVDVCLAALSLAGPFAGMLGQHFGVRPVVIAGSVIGAVGLGLCFFSLSFNIVICLFGVVFGIGYGLVSTMMPIIINIYFFKLRSTAMGISISGACFGSAILPGIMEFLIDIYEISGCLLLMGGMVLNVAVAGALTRQLPSSKRKVQRECLPLVEKSSLSINSYPLVTPERKNSASLNNFIESEKEYEGDLDPNSNPQRELQAELLRTLHKRIARQSSTVEPFQEESYDSLDTSLSSFCGRKEETLYKESDDLLKAQKEFEDTLSDFQSVVVDIEVTSKSDDVLNRFDPDEVKTSDLTDSCPARHSFSVSSAKRKQLMKNSKKETRKVSDSHSLPASKTDGISGSGEDLIHHDLVDSLFQRNYNKPFGIARSLILVATSAAFYLTTVTSVSFYFLYHVFDNIVVDYSVDHGILKEDTKDVLLVFTACDLFGRLCLGWITDKRYLTRSRFVMLTMTGIGLIFFSLPFATDYWSLMVVCGCYGVLLGCTMVMFPILIVEYLGLEVHAVAYGCMCFPKAIIFINRPFLIGYLYSILGSYENMFFFLGAISILVSVAWFLKKCFLKNDPLHPEESRNEDLEQPS